MTQTPLANRFADYAVKLRFDDLPVVAVHEVKRRFIDSIATAVGAMSAEAYAVARRCALRVSSEPGASLTVWDASSSRLTLAVMLGAVVIFLPIILAYTAFVYRVMRGPVRAEDDKSKHAY